MISLYPARRIPQGMILIGSAFMVGVVAIGIWHFVFGVPVYDRNTGQLSSDFTVVILLLAFGGIGALLVLAGRAVLRAASEHHRRRTNSLNGS
jgi:hypothetical protein